MLGNCGHGLHSLPVMSAPVNTSRVLVGTRVNTRMGEQRVQCNPGALSSNAPNTPSTVECDLTRMDQRAPTASLRTINRLGATNTAIKAIISYSPLTYIRAQLPIRAILVNTRHHTAPGSMGGNTAGART